MTQLSDEITSGIKASQQRKNSGDFDHFEHQSNVTHELHTISEEIGHQSKPKIRGGLKDDQHADEEDQSSEHLNNLATKDSLNV